MNFYQTDIKYSSKHYRSKLNKNYKTKVNLFMKIQKIQLIVSGVSRNTQIIFKV